MTARKRIVKRVGCVLGIVALVVLGPIAANLYFLVYHRIPESYAVWGTGELLVDHAKENNELPESWDDLAAAWNEGIAMHAIGVVSFKELQELVEIDFNRLDELRDSYPDRSSIPRVVRTSSDRTSRWGDNDANWMLNEYFNKGRKEDER